MQPEDSGVYQLVHVSSDAELRTNELLIEVIGINTSSTISPSTSKELHIYSSYIYVCSYLSAHVITHIPSCVQARRVGILK